MIVKLIGGKNDGKILHARDELKNTQIYMPVYKGVDIISNGESYSDAKIEIETYKYNQIHGDIALFFISWVYLNHAANGAQGKSKHLCVSHVLSEFNMYTV